MSDLYLNDKLIKQNFALGSKVNLTGLTPNTTYTLYLKDGSTTVSSKTFKTLTKINVYAIGAKNTNTSVAASKNFFDKSRSNNSYLVTNKNGSEVVTTNGSDWTSANFIPVPNTANGVYYSTFGTTNTSTTASGQIAFYDSAFNLISDSVISLSGTDIERSNIVRIPARGKVSYMKIHVAYQNNTYFYVTFTYNSNYDLNGKSSAFLLNGNIAPFPNALPSGDYRYHLDGSNQNTDRGTNSKGLHIREHNYYLEIPLELDKSYGIYTVSGAVMGTGSYTPSKITVGLGQNGNVNNNQLNDVPVKMDIGFPYFTFTMDLEDYPSNYQVLLLYPAAGGYTGSSNAKATCEFSDIKVERTASPTMFNGAPFTALGRYSYQIFDKINADTLVNQGSWDLQVPSWAAGTYLVASTSDLSIGSNYDFTESNNLKINAQGNTATRLMSYKQNYTNMIELSPNSTNSLAKVSFDGDVTNKNIVVNSNSASNRKLYLIETSNGGASRNWAAGLYNPRDGLLPFSSDYPDSITINASTTNNYRGGKVPLFKFTNTSTLNRYVQSPWFKIIPGERYMLSYTAWANVYFNTINTYVYFKKKQSNTDLSGTAFDSDIPLDSRVYIFTSPDSTNSGTTRTNTFTTPSDVAYAYLRFDNSGTYYGSGATLFFGDIKLCRGNNLGTYCQALEDAAPDTTYKVKQIIDVDKDNHVFDYTPSDLTVNGAFLVSSPRTYKVGDTLGRDDLYNLNMLTAGSVENSNLNSLNQLRELNAVDIWFGLTNNIHDLTIRGSEPLGDWVINASNNIRGSLL